MPDSAMLWNLILTGGGGAYSVVDQVNYLTSRRD
jgi:hypothetical protein